MLKDFTAKDIAKRQYLNYPLGWHAEPTWDDAPDVAVEDQVSPNFKATLMALGAAWKSSLSSTTGFYDLLTYTQKQSRINTATGFWLDYIALDFTDGSLMRHLNETDDRFRRRLQIEIMRPKGTRCALECGIANLTGYPAKVIEPMNPDDTGAWAQVGDAVTAPWAWSTAGAWGSLKYPFQLFVTAIRPLGAGIPNVGGWSTSSWGWQTLGGSQWGFYGANFPPNLGNGQWSTRDQIGGDVTDADIYQNIHESMPAGTVAWTNITDDVPFDGHYGTGMLDFTFYLDFTCLAETPQAAPAPFTGNVPLDIGVAVYLNTQPPASATITMPIMITATMGSESLANINIPLEINTNAAVSPYPSQTIPLEIGMSSSIQQITYLNGTPPFILGQSPLVPPGGKLGRTFILGYSKLGAGIYGY